jgi:DNA primase
MTVVDDIKARIDIVDLVSETVNLRRSGKNYTGFCPFHANSKTPAFAVFADSGTWRCFGECNEGGDIFKYVMKKEGCDFPEALRILAQRAGVELEPQTPQKKAEDERADKLRALLEETVIFYRHYLLSAPEGAQARAYIEKRGLTRETIETFGLGYAPDSWDAALNHFTARGYTSQDLLDAGLLSERREGEGFYDRFRNRLMFAIRDVQGRMAGFGARVLNPEDVPKYLNSPQTILFDKGQLLYGLDRARKAIRSQDQVVIVEGYMDVIVPHQAGYENVVSPMGTALSEHHLRQLKRYTRRMVMALDPDVAGQKATLRGLETARHALDRSAEMDASHLFDPRGLVRSEGRLEADLRVCTLPEGLDPDEIVLRDPQEWERLIAAADPIVIHVMNTLAAGRDLEDPKVKSDIAAQVVPLIRDVPNAVERDAYRQRLARLLRVDEEALLPGRPTSAPRRPGKSARQAAQPAQHSLLHATDSVQRARGMETHALQLMLHMPDALYTLDRVLQQEQLSRFTPQDFEQGEYQALARLIQQSLEEDHMDPQDFLAENLPESLESLAAELRNTAQKDALIPEKSLEELILTIMRLRKLRVQEGLQQLQYLQLDLQVEEGMQTSPYQELVFQYTQTLARLNRALGRPLKLD